jgi:hypothetical protein
VTTSTSCSRSPATPRDRRCHPRPPRGSSTSNLVSGSAARPSALASSLSPSTPYLLTRPSRSSRTAARVSTTLSSSSSGPSCWATSTPVAINLEEVVKIESSIKKQMVEGCGDESEPVRAMRGRPQCGMRLSLLAGSRACPLRTSVAADPAARACRRRPRQRRAPCRHPWHKPSDPFRASVVTAVVFLRSVTKHDSNLIR